jgi:hypothetical protein
LAAQRGEGDSMYAIQVGEQVVVVVFGQTRAFGTIESVRDGHFFQVRDSLSGRLVECLSHEVRLA